jgi:predicted glycoside hydrolase/deacetylase ChbG (UPF0249 family)
MPAADLRPLVLCADDFGMTPGVSRAILDLAQRGRLSATSAMTTRPHWPGLARAIYAIESMAVGLHLDLTLGPSRGGFAARPLKEIIALSTSRRLPQAALEEEIARQLDAFEAAAGRLPAFIDGHQHVHALPGVRDALLGVLTRRGLAGRLWLRDPADRLSAIRRRKVEMAKALTVAALASGFASRAHAAGFETNSGFSGFSAFDPARDYGADFARYLVAPGPRHLVMCHPGEVDDELRELDPVTGAREREYAFLASEAFPDVLAQAGFRLAPAWT